MAGGRRRPTGPNNPRNEHKEDLVRSSNGTRRRKSKALNPEVEKYLREVEEKEKQEREERRRKSAKRRAEQSRPPSPSKVTTRKVEPRGQNIPLKTSSEEVTSEPEVPRWIVLGSQGSTPKVSQEESEFIPRNLRGAVRGPDGRLRTTRDPKGRSWKF